MALGTSRDGAPRLQIANIHQDSITSSCLFASTHLPELVPGLSRIARDITTAGLCSDSDMTLRFLATQPFCVSMILTEGTKRLEPLFVVTENPSWQSVSNWQRALMNIQSKGSTRAGCSPTSSLGTNRQALTRLLRSHDPEMIHKATQKPESSAIYSHQILTYIIKQSIGERGE